MDKMFGYDVRVPRRFASYYETDDPGWFTLRRSRLEEFLRPLKDYEFAVLEATEAGYLYVKHRDRREEVGYLSKRPKEDVIDLEPAFKPGSVNVATVYGFRRVVEILEGTPFFYLMDVEFVDGGLLLRFGGEGAYLQLSRETPAVGIDVRHYVRNSYSSYYMRDLHIPEALESADLTTPAEDDAPLRLSGTGFLDSEIRVYVAPVDKHVGKPPDTPWGVAPELGREQLKYVLLLLHKYEAGKNGVAVLDPSRVELHSMDSKAYGYVRVSFTPAEARLPRKLYVHLFEQYVIGYAFDGSSIAKACEALYELRLPVAMTVDVNDNFYICNVFAGRVVSEETFLKHGWEPYEPVVRDVLPKVAETVRSGRYAKILVDGDKLARMLKDLPKGGYLYAYIRRADRYGVEAVVEVDGRELKTYDLLEAKLPDDRVLTATAVHTNYVPVLPYIRVLSKVAVGIFFRDVVLPTYFLYEVYPYRVEGVSGMDEAKMWDWLEERGLVKRVDVRKLNELVVEVVSKHPEEGITKDGIIGELLAMGVAPRDVGAALYELRGKKVFEREGRYFPGLVPGFTYVLVLPITYERGMPVEEFKEAFEAAKPYYYRLYRDDQLPPGFELTPLGLEFEYRGRRYRAGRTLRFVKRDDRWFCYDLGRFVDPEEVVKQEKETLTPELAEAWRKAPHEKRMEWLREVLLSFEDPAVAVNAYSQLEWEMLPLIKREALAKILGELLRERVPPSAVAVPHEVDRVLNILMEAGAPPDLLKEARKWVEGWLNKDVSAEATFYVIRTKAWERGVPLTPKQIGDLCEALGLPRGYVWWRRGR